MLRPFGANFQLLFLQLSQAFGSRACPGARLCHLTRSLPLILPFGLPCGSLPSGRPAARVWFKTHRTNRFSLFYIGFYEAFLRSTAIRSECRKRSGARSKTTPNLLFSPWLSPVMQSNSRGVNHTDLFKPQGWGLGLCLRSSKFLSARF